MLLVLLVLIALVARVDAAAGGASVDLAMRRADARAGAEYAGALDEDGDEDGDEEAEDRAAERAEIDDGEDAEDAEDGEEIDGRGQAANRGLAALTDEIARAASRSGDRVPAPGSDDGGTRSGPVLDGDTALSLVLDGDEADAALSLMLGGDEADAPVSLARGDSNVAGSAGPGVLAMLDAELAPGDATAGLDAADAGAMAGAQEMYEQSMRHQRPSPWARLDVGVSWRRRWSAPIVAPAHRHDEIWLVATWRR